MNRCRFGTVARLNGHCRQKPKKPTSLRRVYGPKIASKSVSIHPTLRPHHFFRAFVCENIQKNTEFGTLQAYRPVLTYSTLYTLRESCRDYVTLMARKIITECAPCADSFFSLKEQIMNLDEMGLALDEEEDIPPTDDEESLA